MAPTPTVWRTLTASPASRSLRRRVWAAGLDPGFYVIDIDGTWVTAQSDKDGAARTYKRGDGFYPLVATLDATGERLVALLRPGNAGSGTAADPITVWDAALAPLPVDRHAQEVIVRADSAGCSHDFLDHAPEDAEVSSPGSGSLRCGGPLIDDTEYGRREHWARSDRRPSLRMRWVAWW